MESTSPSQQTFKSILIPQRSRLQDLHQLTSPTADSGTEGPPKQKLSALPFRVHPSNTSRQPLMANVLGAVDGVAAVFVCAMLTNIQCMQLSQADASAAFDKYHSGNFFLTQPSAGDPAATISSYA